MLIELDFYQTKTMSDFYIRNYSDLDENSIQELIEFSEVRGGYFREDLRRFSIRKRASIEYLEQIFSAVQIDVRIQKPIETLDIYHSESTEIKRPVEMDKKIGFGKYKEETWSEIPMAYLKWVHGAMKGYNAEVAKRVLIYKMALERKERTS